MAKGFRNPFRKETQEKRSRGGSAFDWENVARPSHPPRGQSAAQLGKNMEQSTDFFAAQVMQAGLHQMITALEIWKTGELSEADAEMLKVPASRFLEVGKDADRVHNYSFESFIATFQEKLNTTHPETPTEMIYGQLGFLAHDGVYEAVGDQDSFGVALNNLYLNRGISNVLIFVFQPEFEDNKKRRLEFKDSSPLRRQFEANYNKPERRESFPADARNKIFRTQRLPEHVNPFAILDQSCGGDEITEARAVVSSPSSPNAIQRIVPRPKALPSEGSQSEHTITSTPRTPLSTSSSSGLSQIGSIKAVVKKVIQGPAKKEPETKDEERERFKLLYKEEKIVTFKRGGEETAVEEEAKVLDVVNEETAEEEAEEAEEAAESDEGEDEGEVSNEDRIVTRLQRLLNLEELTQLKGPGNTTNDLSRWENCCAMFRRDPKETDIASLVKIAGLKTKVYQYQAFGVYWQMITSRQLGGGILADDMGLGKTLSFLAYIIVERQLSVLHREVAKSRAANDGAHLLEGQPGECPSPYKSGWIACPCSTTSPSSKMILQPGLRMACVPQGLVGQWWGQWKTHVDVTENELAMKIVIDHPATFNNINITIADRLSSGETAQNTTRMQAERYHAKDGKGDDRPKDYQDGYLLLTTKETYSKFAKKFENNGQIHDAKKHGEWKSGTRSCLIFGIAMIDESHEEYFKNKGRAQILTNLPTWNSSARPFVWGYSGTPFSQTPRGIEGVLWAIEKHCPKPDVNFKWEKLDAICKKYDKQIKSNKRDDEVVGHILAAFKPFLVRFLIRRTAETKWFGSPSLIKLNPHIHQDIYLQPNEKFDALIPAFEAMFDSERDSLLEQLQAKWDNFPDSRRSDIRPTTLGFNTMCRTSWRSRILATFPYLFKLARAEGDGRLSLTEVEVQSFKNAIDKKEFNTPYGRYLRSIVEESPKCMWLYNFIPQILEQKDVAGNDQKLVILTAFPQVAFVLKLFIQRYFPEEKDRVSVIAGRMKGSEKTDIINAFTDAVDPRGKRKCNRDIRFLIGTSRLLGVGLQLTRASQVVLMEPDNEFVRELQGYARVHRIGQKNPLSRSYRLIDSGNEIEEALLKRQRDREEFAGRLTSED